MKMRDDGGSIRSGVEQSVSLAKLGFLELRPKRACNRIGRDPHRYSAVVAEQSVPMPKCKCISQNDMTKLGEHWIR